MHVYSQSKETNAELLPNIIVTRAHLHSSTLQNWRHTHTFTQNPKETEVATSLCAYRVLLPRSSAWSRLAPIPLAWSISLCLAPHVLAARHHGRGLGNERGFRRSLGADRGEETVDTRGRERERKWRTLRPTSGVSGPHRLRRTLGQEPSNRSFLSPSLHTVVCTKGPRLIRNKCSALAQSQSQSRAPSTPSTNLQNGDRPLFL